MFTVNKKGPESSQYHGIYNAVSGNRTDRNEIFINHANHGTIKISTEWNHIYIFRFKFCKEPRFILEIRIKFYWIAYKKLIGRTVIKSYEATCPLPSYSIVFLTPSFLKFTQPVSLKFHRHTVSSYVYFSLLASEKMTGTVFSLFKKPLLCHYLILAWNVVFLIEGQKKQIQR